MTCPRKNDLGLTWDLHICDLVPSLSRPLRSSDLGLLSIPRSLLKSKGDCAFAVRAPSFWNSLPLSVRSAESLNVFKKISQNPSLSSCIPYNWTVISLCAYLYMYVYFILSILFCLLLRLFSIIFWIMFYVYCTLYSPLQTFFWKKCYINKNLLTYLLLQSSKQWKIVSGSLQKGQLSLRISSIRSLCFNNIVP